MLLEKYHQFSELFDLKTFTEKLKASIIRSCYQSAVEHTTALRARLSAFETRAQNAKRVSEYNPQVEKDLSLEILD
jgi:hypothetical protein